MIMNYSTMYEEPPTQKMGEGEEGDDEDELIFTGKKLSKIKKDATAKDINERLAFQYAKEKAEYVGKQLSETSKIKAETTQADLKNIVNSALLDVTNYPNFYESMNIELKIAGSKLGRGDVGIELLKSDVLEKAASIYLDKVVDYANKYGVKMKLDKKTALEASVNIRKAADIEANYGYA